MPAAPMSSARLTCISSLADSRTTHGVAIDAEARRDVDLARQPHAGHELALHERALEIVGDLAPQRDTRRARRQSPVVCPHRYPHGAGARHQSFIAGALS